MPPIIIPELFIKPLTLVTFESNCIDKTKESVDVAWMLEAHNNVASLRQIGSYGYKVQYGEDLESRIICKHNGNKNTTAAVTFPVELHTS